MPSSAGEIKEVGGYVARYAAVIVKNVIGWALMLSAMVLGGFFPIPIGTPLFLVGFALITLPGKRRLTERGAAGASDQPSRAADILVAGGDCAAVAAGGAMVSGVEEAPADLFVADEHVAADRGLLFADCRDVAADVGVFAGDQHGRAIFAAPAASGAAMAAAARGESASAAAEAAAIGDIDAGSAGRRSDFVDRYAPPLSVGSAETLKDRGRFDF